MNSSSFLPPKQANYSGKGRHRSAGADSANLTARGWARDYLTMSYDFGGKRALVTGAGKGIHHTIKTQQEVIRVY